MSLTRKIVWLLIRNRRDAAKAAFLLSLMFTMAAAEAFGVGLIMPFVALIQRPEAINEPGALRDVVQLAGIDNQEGAIYLFGLTLVFAFTAKNVFISFAQFWQSRYTYAKQAEMSRRLLELYLKQPYTFHLNRNPSDLVVNIVHEVAVVFHHVVASQLLLLVETLSVVVVTAVLVVIEPVAVPLVGGVLAIFAYGVNRLIHRKTDVVAHEFRHDQLLMHRAATQALAAVKEARIAGCEQNLIEHFRGIADRHGAALGSHRAMLTLPRTALETLGVVGLVLVTFLIYTRGGDTEFLLPVLGVMAVAAVRLMPAVARIVAALSLIRHYAPSIDAVFADFRDLESAPAATSLARVEPCSFERELRAIDVEFKYPNSDEAALKCLSIVIERGTSVAFVGPSGGGKTTLVDVLVGIHTPDSGRVEVDGTWLRGDDVRAWQRLIGYIPQQIFLCDDSIRRNVAFGIEDSDIDDERMWRALEIAQIDSFVRSLPERLDTEVGDRGVRLSGGQRQRLGIARAMYLEPRVLVMDEATSALDGITERDVIVTIERLRSDRTLLVIAHRLSTVRRCDRLVFVDGGKIIDEGSWDDLISRNATFREMVRLEAKTIESTVHPSDAAPIEVTAESTV